MLVPPKKIVKTLQDVFTQLSRFCTFYHENVNLGKVRNMVTFRQGQGGLTGKQAGRKSV